MRTIRKGNEPDSLLEYRKTENATFEGYPEKHDLQTQIVAEQRGLCCYCQSRIRASYNGMKIEHWQSQSPNKYPERQLDYVNLLGACQGGVKHGQKSPIEHHHCDTAKRDEDLCFCLTDTAHPIERRIYFSGDGRICSDEPDIQRDLDRVLNLNLSQLMDNRKSTLDAFKQRLDRGPVDVATELPKWDGSREGDLPPFAQVVVSWLEKKRRRSN